MTVTRAEPAGIEAAVAAAAEAIRPALRGRAPEVAVVLGSGLGGFTGRIEDAVRLPYGRIPGFPLPTVEGHGGELVIGRLAGRDIIAQSGRFHMYEGHSAALSALPVRVFGALGARTLVLTNAAGGIRRSFQPGTLMLIADHINLTGRNPLIGPVVAGEERFPDMSDPYDSGLRAIARAVAREARIALAEGVYVGLLGPTYETPAEIRMLERLGGDAVGMSTVMEVIAARARGMRCVGVSTVTNLASGISPTPLSHAEVMEVASAVRLELGTLIEGLVGRLD